MNSEKKHIKEIEYKDLFFKSLKVLHEILLDDRIPEEVKDEIGEKIVNINSK